MMKRNLALASVATLCLGLGACSSDNVHLSPNPPITGSAAPVQYVQIERLSRPAVKEVFEPFQDHQISNGLEPYADATIAADIVATEDFVRPPNTTVGSDYGKVLASVLYPDEYLVNLAGSTPTSTNPDPEFFLSTEVDGASYFGGRSPSDDVVGLELPVLFGHTLAALKIAPEDNAENDCLSAQNIAQASTQAPTTTFPYLATPH